MMKRTIFSSLLSVLFFSLRAAENKVIVQQPKRTESAIGRLTPAEELCGACVVVTPINTAVGVAYAAASHSPTMTATICKTMACLYGTEASCILYAICCLSLSRTTKDNKNK